VDEFKRQLTEMHNLNTLRSDYQKTLLLLRAIKAGTVSMDQFTLTDAGWQIVEPEIVSDQPASIPMASAE